LWHSHKTYPNIISAKEELTRKKQAHEKQFLSGEVKGKYLLEQVAAKLLWELVSLEKLTSFLNSSIKKLYL